MAMSIRSGLELSHVTGSPDRVPSVMEIQAPPEGLVPKDSDTPRTLWYPSPSPLEADLSLLGRAFLLAGAGAAEALAILSVEQLGDFRLNMRDHPYATLSVV